MRPKLTLRPSFTPSEEVSLELEQNSGFGSQIQSSQDEETMKSTLQEALLGPSIVAVALGSMMFVKTSADAQESNAKNTAPKIQVVIPDVGQPLQTEPDISQPTEKTAFAVTAAAIKETVERGESPEFTIEIQNISNKNATLVSGSGQKFDFSAFKIGAKGEVESKPTWKWSSGMMFTMAIVSKNLAPNEKFSYKATWKDAPAGKYQIKGLITANGGIEAAPFNIEVK